MRTARFANVAITSSIKRLRTNGYQRRLTTDTRRDLHHGEKSVKIGPNRCTTAASTCSASGRTQTVIKRGQSTASKHAIDDNFAESHVVDDEIFRDVFEEDHDVPVRRVESQARPLDREQRQSRSPAGERDLRIQAYLEGVESGVNVSKPDLRDLKNFESSLPGTYAAWATQQFRANHDLLTSSAIISKDEVMTVNGWLSRRTSSNDTRTPRLLNYQWSRNFAAMYARTLHGCDNLEPVLFSSQRKRFATLAKLLREIRGQEDSREEVIHDLFFEFTENVARWPAMMVMIMRYLPDMTLDFMQATCPRLEPAASMVADVVDYIVRFGLTTSTAQYQPTAKITPEQAVESIIELVSQCNHTRPQLHSSTVHRLLEHLNVRYAHALFNALRSFDAAFDQATCVAFAKFFAHHSEYESSLDAFELCIEHGGRVEDLSVRLAAHKLLRRSVLHPQGYHDSGEIVRRLVEMGFPISRDYQNTLISNAFDSGDSATALNVFALMKEQGKEPDAVTYGALLKGLRDSEDQGLMDDILGLSWAKVEEEKSDRLAAEVLYWHYIRNVRKAAAVWDKDEKAIIHNQALAELVALYTRLYNRKPLEVLGFRRVVPEWAWSPPQSLGMRPSSDEPFIFIMVLMIIAYTRARVLALDTRHAAEGPASMETNISLYDRFWLIATERKRYPEVLDWVSDLFVDMMRASPRTLNMFIHALGTQDMTLPMSIRILERMEKGEITIHAAEGDKIVPIARTNLYSWSILLNAFARHGQVEAAEKVFSTMERKGITPNGLVWNTLVKAYATIQDAEGVMRTLRNKEAAGYGMDNAVERTLSRFKNKPALKRLMQEEVEQREQERLQTQHPRWAPQQEEYIGYEPGRGRRSVNYFDANRTMGLHDESWRGVEDQQEVAYSPVDASPGPHLGSPSTILRGQGSFTLKSDDEQDWFEDDEEELDGVDGEFGTSPMDGFEKKDR